MTSFGVISLSFHTCEGRRRGFCCCKINLGEIVERRSKEGILGYPQALEEREIQDMVKGSLGSPIFSHMCGGNNCRRGQKI